MKPNVFKITVYIEYFFFLAFKFILCISDRIFPHIKYTKKIKSKKQQLAIVIIYQEQERLPYKVIEEKIKLILDRLSEEI